MVETLETKTLNGKLILEGFEVLTVIPNKKLPEYLVGVMIEFARRKYKDLRIIPGDFALEGSEWGLEEPSHIIYVKDNQNHRDYKPNSVYVVLPNLINKKTKNCGPIMIKSIK